MTFSLIQVGSKNIPLCLEKIGMVKVNKKTG